MYVRLVWGKIRRGMWGEYKKWYMESLIPATEGVKGCQGRQLFRSVDDPDEGMSFTLWDSREDMDAYERSEPREELSRGAEHLYAGDYWIKHFDQEFSSD